MLNCLKRLSFVYYLNMLTLDYRPMEHVKTCLIKMKLKLMLETRTFENTKLFGICHEEYKTQNDVFEPRILTNDEETRS